ncbi:bifunctional adenosylcobinamide kinase/adenosylcobinamide-phosphate guanylyltransferase [Peribacillus huizhouensis]|uniref:Adenosylcobinamide kinase n=1 Tax=Peribacillus huizhouensis TaxID=1501239 RepID=A0ABR6CTH7_9BACI|nr:bifunctional adenosylcobinamide kinase/adenosylcobinamide-phosphate guanylyltransferase [Peribacillus huizhouensis]MBA9027958.1 adenosylcobinamide kinase/adenosylcobinamide-phosphate guanylyltransferase [Peribacillus huizhouensis]
MEKAPVYFITGGVRSGKSTFAEEIAHELARTHSGTLLYYLACGRAQDEEMQKRIELHQQSRQNSVIPWALGEFPRNIDHSIPFYSKQTIVLLDCLTTWLDNELFSINSGLSKEHLQNVMRNMLESIETIRKHCYSLIVVSNEVLHEPLTSNEIVQAYQKTIGKLHQELVARSNQAYLVEAGIPILMKGNR